MKNKLPKKLLSRLGAAWCFCSLLGAALFPAGLISLQPIDVKAQVLRADRGRLTVPDEDFSRLLENTKQAKTIAEIPPAFREAVKRKYDSSPAIQKETKFDRFLAGTYTKSWDELENKIKYKNVSVFSGGDMCDDGTFESGQLNSSVWNGFWTGQFQPNISDPNLPIASWTGGLLPVNGVADPAFDANCFPNPTGVPHNQISHHKVIAAGNDPIVPANALRTVPGTPTVNSGSLMLGNPCPNYGGERVEKTFTVKPGQTKLSFWYATVLQNPVGHTADIQPGFGVYVYDTASGAPIPNPIDIDYGTPGNQNFLVSDQNNPFFQTFTYKNEPAVYRPWTCVEIDLTGLEGKTLKLVLANRDCGAGGHWGYSYVDNLCLGCAGSPTGSADFNPVVSKDCGNDGKICFDYTVPQVPGKTGAVNGTVQISLQLFQNGNPVGSPIAGPVMNKDGQYCFSGSQILGVANGDLDWVATANYTAPGAAISPKTIGSKLDGFLKGQNNDFKKDCKSCCGIGKNFIDNGSFDPGKKMPFSSKYNKEFKIFSPGDYLVGDSADAAKECGNWNVLGHSDCKDPKDDFLIVNGLTNQAGSAPVSVWAQQVSVDGEGEYEFCAWFKDLKQCCFNQNPRITLQANVNGKIVTQNAVISTGGKPCDWQLVSAKVTVPKGVSAIDLQILLDGSVMGDGNDVAIDDISLTKAQALTTNETQFNFQGTWLNGTQYNLQVTPVKPLKPDCKYSWSAVKLKKSDMTPDAATRQIWTVPSSSAAFDLNGYPTGTSGPKGIFEMDEWYEVSFKVECDCAKPQVSSMKIYLSPPSSSPAFRTSPPRSGTAIPAQMFKVERSAAIK